MGGEKVEGKGKEGKEGELAVGWTPGQVPLIEDYRSVMLQRAVFQSVASMGLPAFTIHSLVRYSGRALKDVRNVRVRTWGPIGVSLAFSSLFLPSFPSPSPQCSHLSSLVSFSFHLCL